MSPENIRPCLKDVLLFHLAIPKQDHCNLAVIPAADRCIDQYVQLRNDTTEDGKSKAIDERLSAIVERLFER